MAVRRLKNSITVSGDDVKNLKRAIRESRKKTKECVYCGGYGYLGVRDELCICDQEKAEPEHIVVDEDALPF